jgi:hypothetical protein
MFKKNSNELRLFSRLMLVIFMLGLAGCQTIPTLPAVNLGESGWNIRQGQAIWRNKKDAPEIAGELLVAVNPDGRSFVQFTKTPLPFVVAQTTSNSWQIHFVPVNKTYSAHGHAPAQLPWLHLTECLAGKPPPKKWRWEQPDAGSFRLQNPSTGEMIEGYLNP